MILESKTLETFGYEFKSLSKNSHKRVCIKCDYCGKEYDAVLKNRTLGYKKLPKDACNDCRYVKREEMGNNPFSRPEVKEKIRQKNVEKYGVEWHTQSESFKEKSKQTCLEKYGVEFATQHDTHKKNSTNTKIKMGLITLVEGKSLKDIAKEKGYSYSHFLHIKKTYGLEEALEYTSSYTNIEKKMSNILNSLKVSYKYNSTLGKFRPDFILEDKNIIIETDGLYWHSDLHLPNNYHKNKREYYIEKGYFPLFFREDEILKKEKIVESIIKNKINMSNKIYARKTIIKKVEKDDSRQFLEQNHLMGPGIGRSYGLYYNNELLLLIQVKKIKDAHEISRLCSKNGYTIVGGFSKLLKHLDLNRIKTFVDLRYGNGEHLKNLGFREISNSMSFNWTDGVSRFHRMKFPGNTGYKNNLVKIWDCGQKCFVNY